MLMGVCFRSLVVPTARSISPSRSERLSRERAGERRTLAISRVQQATAALAELGVKARIIGSLASGRFRPGSDIDFLIVECPRHLKYAIEGIVEDCLGELPFDVIYLDEVPAHKLDRLTGEAVDAGDLR
jgi:predicted nucleotidyltransferase